jgi:hypothetical protein
MDVPAWQTKARNPGTIAGSGFMCVTVQTKPNVGVKLFFSDCNDGGDLLQNRFFAGVTFA